MTERRYERLHPREMERLATESPVAWVPIGPMEFHGPHLPFGVDAFEARGLCLRAADLAGGVVLPPSYLATGTLDLPFTLDYSPSLVEGWARETLGQLARRGFRVVVVLTGHGPLDLSHLLKRVCAESEAQTAGLRAYGLCWLELNAARMEGPQEGEPTVVDHAALVETSWMLHLEPELVHLDRLAGDPEASHLGVYGTNPRFTASQGFGADQVSAAAALLAERVRALLGGGTIDPLADLRRFVEVAWAEPLRLAGGAEGLALALTNVGRSSRYVSGLRVSVDGHAIADRDVLLVNESPGETGIPVRSSDLGPERGFYIRRGQTAEVRLGRVIRGRRHVEARIGLGGVTETTVTATIDFTGADDAGAGR